MSQADVQGGPVSSHEDVKADRQLLSTPETWQAASWYHVPVEVPVS